MGEIDHADDAVNHRVADGDQAIDGAERDAVDELLEKIHRSLAAPAPAAGGTYSPSATDIRRAMVSGDRDSTVADGVGVSSVIDFSLSPFLLVGRPFARIIIDDERERRHGSRAVDLAGCGAGRRVPGAGDRRDHLRPRRRSQSALRQLHDEFAGRHPGGRRAHSGGDFSGPLAEIVQPVIAGQTRPNRTEYDNTGPWRPAREIDRTSGWGERRPASRRFPNANTYDLAGAIAFFFIFLLFFIDFLAIFFFIGFFMVSDLAGAG